MAEINVREVEGPPVMYEVKVEEGGSATTHRVDVPEALYQKLTGGRISKAECVKHAFEFLLDREPKESIYSQFKLSVISNYFPEFEREFPKYLERP